MERSFSTGKPRAALSSFSVCRYRCLMMLTCRFFSLGDIISSQGKSSVEQSEHFVPFFFY